MKTYYLMIDINVQVNYEIKAESLEDALEKAKSINTVDCIKPAKRTVSINDGEVKEILGVFN